jgi:hypothetical protein
MIERLSDRLRRIFLPSMTAPAAAIRVGTKVPDESRKTKADVRREILGKLTRQMERMNFSTNGINEQD